MLLLTTKHYSNAFSVNFRRFALSGWTKLWWDINVFQSQNSFVIRWNISFKFRHTDFLSDCDQDNCAYATGGIFSEKYCYYFHCPNGTLQCRESADSKPNAISKYIFQDSFLHMAMRKKHHTLWKKNPLEVPGFTISFLGVKFSLVLSFSIGALYTISEFRMDVFWKSFLEKTTLYLWT